MPRRARISIPGIPWHIIQRGNNRSAIFFADEDYQLYLHHLKEQAGKYECDIHAYVLMTNHVHLLLTPKQEDSAALLMKNLGQRYVQYINRTYQRSGTLWEGRFRSCLAQSENYVLACYRYIELNPVRASMVNHPREYPWSSYKANAEGKKRKLITPHDQYLRLDHRELERRKAYRSLFKAHIDQSIDDEIRVATNGNYVLGSKRYQEQIAQALGRRVTRGKAGRPKKG
ncbi:MAG: transposase [Gammaproteobacteria bacterium]|nr:transposase [Gammaproteobacteria bacterium]